MPGIAQRTVRVTNLAICLQIGDNMDFQSTETIRDEKGKITGVKKFTYVRPKEDGEISGKLNLRFAKREKVRAMKAADHPKGDNRPWSV